MLRYAQHDKEVNKLLYLVQGSSTLKTEHKDSKKTEKNRLLSVKRRKRKACFSMIACFLGTMKQNME